MTEANFRAGGKVVLKVKEKLCGKVEKTRRRIICTRRRMIGVACKILVSGVGEILGIVAIHFLIIGDKEGGLR